MSSQISTDRYESESEKYDVVIIGGGPAGLSAGIYGIRSGLKCIILEKGVSGGQVLTGPWIENYPGFPHIEGPKLAERIISHAKDYIEIREGAEVTAIEQKEETFVIRTRTNEIECRGIILCTGATHRPLEVPGEKEYFGRGVSYCATCDGFFFREKNVVVIGGGNAAVTDALYLMSIGCRVTLIHRRNELRADKHLQGIAQEKKMDILYDTAIEKILGKDEVVVGVSVTNVKSGKTEMLSANGVFISVGIIPKSDLAKSLCVELDENGYVKVGQDNRTNIPLVYAAGDLTGGILQIVAAMHGGAVAALSAFEDLADPYYARTRVSEHESCPLPENNNSKK